MLAVVQSSGSVLLSIVCWKKCVIIGINSFVSSFNMFHLEEHNVITDKQHAFRKHHSCETQLCLVIHDWARNIDKNKQTDIFILDFEKALDFTSSCCILSAEISSPIFVPKSLVYLYHFAISYSLWWNQLLCNRHNHQQTNVYLSLRYQVYHVD
jgi:hypothetical protein